MGQLTKGTLATAAQACSGTRSFFKSLEPQAWKPDRSKESESKNSLLNFAQIQQSYQILKSVVHQAHGFSLMACPKVLALIRGS